MQLIKKEVSPGGVKYAITLSIWQAAVISGALVVGVVLMFTLFFVWWVSSRRHKASNDN